MRERARELLERFLRRCGRCATHPALYALLWVGVILAVFVPLSTRRDKRAASR